MPEKITFIATQAPLIMTLQKRRLIVLSSTVLLTIVYWFMALWYENKGAYSKDLVVFHALFGHLFSIKWVDLYQYFYQFTVTILLFVAAPWLITKYWLKEDFIKLCWRSSHNRTALIVCAIVYPLVIGSTWFSSAEPVLQSEYPLSKLIGSSVTLFALYQCSYFFYFFGYETFFRGYLQFGMLSNKPGTKEVVAILLIQTLVTTAFHTGKPGTEVWSAALFGPVLGYVAIRFNSIWYGMLIHFLMNVFMDFFILYRLHLLPQHLF